MTDIKTTVEEVERLISKKNKEKAFSLINSLRVKTNYILFIQKYIGLDGLIPFEHGYIISDKFADFTELFEFKKLWSVSENYLYTSIGRISLNSLKVNQLQLICKALVDYAIYCKITV